VELKMIESKLCQKIEGRSSPTGIPKDLAIFCRVFHLQAVTSYSLSEYYSILRDFANFVAQMLHRL
jgi:hypothetical protein